MFFDEAKIYVKAGDGGNGVVAFRREAHVPRGGPSGGNGGRGADVYLVADPQVNTLIQFSHQVHFRAPNGEPGQGKNQTGAQGSELVIRVPVGTVARDDESGEILADLVRPGQRAQVGRGGRGGRGNNAFKSSTHQAPRIAENGEPGTEHWLRLELKLIADVGIVGMPNAGKSTLLARVSAARPKIADYPFTTLQPNLGVVVIDDRDIVLADIPGLIEGAHTGAGLGHAFLRHIERTRVLIHMLNGISPDPVVEVNKTGMSSTGSIVTVSASVIAVAYRILQINSKNARTKSPRPVYCTLRLVDFQAQLLAEKAPNACQHPLASPPVSHRDVAVVRIAHEPMPPRFQFLIQIIQHDVRQQR